MSLGTYSLLHGGRAAMVVYQRLTLEVVQVDGLPFEARDPRPDRDVGDGIVAGDEVAASSWVLSTL